MVKLDYIDVQNISFSQFFSLYICIFYLSQVSYLLHESKCMPFHAHILYWVTSIMFSTCLPLELSLTLGIKPEGDSGSYGSVGSPVGGPECRSAEFDGLQAQCDQAMHQLQLLRHKHSDTIRRFVLILFPLFSPRSPASLFLLIFFTSACMYIYIYSFSYIFTHFTHLTHICLKLRF